MGADATNEPAALDAAQELTDDTPAPPPTPAEPKPLLALILKRWRRLLWWAPWLFPNWGAVNRSDRVFERAHDARENEETRVPPELELRVPMVWGCELYGPAEINGLYTGLEKLGWGVVGRIGDRDGIAKWIRESRAYGQEGGWLNGGHVAALNERGKYLGNYNYAPLPEGVSYLNVQVLQLSPSLTGILIGFRLDDTVAQCYEIEINRDRKTYRRRIRRARAISIIGPKNQKKEAMALVRSNLRSLVATWFKRNLPGYFSNLDRNSAFPIMELMSVKEGPVLHEPPIAPRTCHHNWRWLLRNVGLSRYVWMSRDHDGLQFVLADDSEGTHGSVITVAVDESRFPDEDFKFYGGKSLEALTYLCGQKLSYVLPNAAIVEYLKEQTRYLNLSREQLKVARSGRGNLSRTLRTITQFFDRTLGVPALAGELTRRANQPWGYEPELAEFSAPELDAELPPRDLTDLFRSATRVLASRLAEEEVVMRGHFEQLSSILSIHENVKVQRRIQTLTVLALVVAFLSLLVALAGIHTVADWLKAAWEKQPFS